MKHILFIGALLVASTFTSFAQQGKTVVGKWKFAKVVAEGMTIDVDNPAATKKEVEKMLEAATGQKPDAAMVDETVKGLMSAFKDSYMEFKADGKVKMVGQMGDKSQVEEETYKVDYKAGTIITTGKESKTETLRFKFVGDNLVIETKENGKTVVMTLKPVK